MGVMGETPVEGENVRLAASCLNIRLNAIASIAGRQLQSRRRNGLGRCLMLVVLHVLSPWSANNTVVQSAATVPHTFFWHSFSPVALLSL